MKVSFHCFANGVKIDRRTFSFPFKETILTISTYKKDSDEGLMLELTRSADPQEFAIDGEVKDEQGLFIEKRMLPFKELLTEAASLIEGLFSIFYIATPPKFDTDRIIVNVITETPEEEDLLKSGKITGGFGNIFQPSLKSFYQIKDNLSISAKNAIMYLPELSFLSQAIRSQSQNDQEVALCLYFKIIEGYFSESTPNNTEKALLKNSEKLSKYIIYDDKIKSTTKSILCSLKFESKSHINFKGLISDIVLIRHKLSHFSKNNYQNHYQAGVKSQINVLNLYLRRACTVLLLEEIEIN